MVIEVRVAGLTVSTADCDDEPNVPIMVTDWTVATPVVMTIKVAVVWPAATVTVAGTVPAELLLESCITTPPVGAVPLKVMVPFEE